jgi:hypothetical protein
MTKEERKSERRLKRYKIRSEMKRVVDQKEDTEDIVLTAYQNKNDQGWVKVEISYKKKKI